MILIWLPKLLPVQKDTEIENKIPDTTSFITTPNFNRLTKLSLKSEVKNTLDLGDKNRVKMKDLFQW